MCLGNLRATEEMSSLFLLNSRNCSRVISNAAACFTVLPGRFSRFFSGWGFWCTGNIHISVGSTSHGNFSSIKFSSSILPYLELHLWASLGFGLVDEQLDSCLSALVMCPRYKLDRWVVEVVFVAPWLGGKESCVWLIGEWQQLRERSRQFQSCVGVHKVRRLYLVICFRLMCGHFSVAWAKDLLLFFLSLSKQPNVSLLQDYRNHLDACAVQLVIYLWYGLYSIIYLYLTELLH